MEQHKKSGTQALRPARAIAGDGATWRPQPGGRHPLSGLPSTEGVLIISDDAEFARTVVAHWQTERSVPAFTLIASELCSPAAAGAHRLAIIAPGAKGLQAVVAILEAAGTAILCVVDPARASQFREAHPHLLAVQQLDGWLDVLVQMAGEVSRRVESNQRAFRAEQNLADSERQATLGRYMLEMRHALNNCLTSVLGNAELLLLEPGIFSAETRDQMHTIHTMALRMHEVLQRFSSLEAEMRFAEKESHSETALSPRARACGA